MPVSARLRGLSLLPIRLLPQSSSIRDDDAVSGLPATSAARPPAVWTTATIPGLIPSSSAAAHISASTVSHAATTNPPRDDRHGSGARVKPGTGFRDQVARTGCLASAWHPHGRNRFFSPSPPTAWPRTKGIAPGSCTRTRAGTPRRTRGTGCGRSRFHRGRSPGSAAPARRRSRAKSRTSARSAPPTDPAPRRSGRRRGDTGESPGDSGPGSGPGRRAPRRRLRLAAAWTGSRSVARIGGRVKVETDKEYLHVDIHSPSGCLDTVYLTRHEGNILKFARSTDRAHTWSMPVSLSSGSSERGIGSDITTDAEHGSPQGLPRVVDGGPSGLSPVPASS